MKFKNAGLFTCAVIAMLMLFATSINAQKIEVSPFIGYQTGANAHTNNGYFHVGDGMNFGGSIDVGLGGGRYAELSYSHLKSYLDGDKGLNNVRLCDLNVDYYSAGILQELKPGGKVSPFGMFTIGWVNYRPSGKYSNENVGDIGLAGGIKIRATEKIGLRLQARMFLPIYLEGMYFSGGTGGAGMGMAATTMGVQGDFTAALVFMLGK
jgi:hypothetical protein